MAEQNKNSNHLSDSEEKALQSFLESLNTDMLRSALPPVSTATALKFLMARKFEVSRALKLFHRHLEVRAKYKMAEMKPLDEPLSKELLSEKLTILDRVKEHKAAVILVNGKHYKQNEQNDLVMIQSLMFQLDEALRDISTQRNGLILIYNMTDSGRENFNYKLSLEILHLLKDAYPARLKKILIISAPLWFKVSFKIISTFLNEKIRDRVEFADVEGIKGHLEEECIPKDLGGTWDVNHSLWMSRCIESYQDGNCDEPCFQRTGHVKDSEQRGFETPKQPSPKRVPDINVPPEEPSRNGAPRSGAPSDGMTVLQLLAHMSEKGSLGIKKEFESLATFDRSAPYHVFKSPYNKQKNRYVDVICLDESRVQLPVVNGDKTTDYIHANFVDGYHGNKAYIAAQGPLPATFIDFWRMIWTTGTAVIVMLTKEIQRGRVKCGRYWPDPGAFEQYNDIEVSCLEAIKKDDFIKRQFLISNVKTKESRTVHQIQMISWPDFGVPDSAEPIFQLKSMVEDLLTAGTQTTQSQRPPVVVHCSAGIGRTGSYCTISIGIDSLLNTGRCNIIDTVKRIRGQRALSVQTADQYELCYTSLLEYAALHVASIEAQEKIDILEFLNDWKRAQTEVAHRW